MAEYTQVHPGGQLMKGQTLIQKSFTLRSIQKNSQFTVNERNMGNLTHSSYLVSTDSHVHLISDS